MATGRDCALRVGQGRREGGRTSWPLLSTLPPHLSPTMASHLEGSHLLLKGEPPGCLSHPAAPHTTARESFPRHQSDPAMPRHNAPEAAPSRPRPRWAGSAHLLRRLLSEACRCLTTTATLAGGSVSVVALACLGALDLALRHAAWNALPLLSTGSSKVLSLEPGPRPQSQCRVVLWDFMFFSEPLNI